MLKKHTKLCLSLLAGVMLFGCSDESNAPVTQDTPAPSGYCGDGVCISPENAAICPADCKENIVKNICGNGVCEDGEDSKTCSFDCPPEPECNNGICESNETSETCPADCKPEKFCGNGICDSNENAKICPSDCKRPTFCGNNICEAGETRLNCLADCGPYCGDGTCDEDEDKDNCLDDCYTEEVEYQSVCGDGVCDDDEKDSCEADCKSSEVTKERLSLSEFTALQENYYRFLFDYDRTQGEFAPKSEDKREQLAQRLDEFFSFPYPSELRTDSYGRPSLNKYAVPTEGTALDVVGMILPAIGKIIPNILEKAQTERAGFSPIGGVYFRTSVTVDQKEFPAPADTLKADSCYQLINVEENSAHYGERVPLYVTYHRPANEFWANNTLVMRPVPAFGANQGDRYVAIVGNCLTANGRKIVQSNKLKNILAGTAPDEVSDKMQYYVTQLDKLITDGKIEMQMSDIRAMTGYRILNAAREMDLMAQDLKGKGSIVTDDKGVAIGEWTDRTTLNYLTPKAYVFHGTFKTMNYISGKFPYESAGEGEMKFKPDGSLANRGMEEEVRFSIVVPRTPMPEKGYPIAVYGHGTGGDADTHMRYSGDEGLVLINNGVPMAMIGFDAVLHGQRGENGKSPTMANLVMMILNEPIVIRESWRQTVLDMLVLYDIIERGKLVLPPIPGSDKNTIFDPSYGLYMGHSQGAQEGGMLLGLTGNIHNAFLSAGGGGVIQSFIDLKPDISTVPVVGTLFENKTVADIVAFVLGAGDDASISYDTFLTTQIIQPLVDPLDPVNFTQRFIKEPLRGTEPKNIAQTIGIGDQSTPNSAQFTMISAIGLPPVGEIFKTSVDMELAGYTTSVGNSVSKNLADGRATGGSMQFNYTGNDNPHFVIYRMESAENSYIDFFKSVLDDNPTVSVSGSQSGDR
ncbi:MAG: hypothetical protein IKY83_08485 [Proteobacteria bacterium]|nr:hypothetical protein [Pseudomonadota bacterium]